MQEAQESDLQHRPPVLNVEQCTLSVGEAQGDVFAPDFAIYPGELVLLHVEDEQHEDALTDAICGLQSPLRGIVTFLQHDWSDLSIDLANALRGRIGVVFRDDCWIPYQPIMDSLVLAQLHHTRRSYEAVCAEAMRLAARFGLPGLPSDLPGNVGANDRQIANLIRAFLGAPSLVVIEHQPALFGSKLRRALINTIRDVRERDAAVLWYVRDLNDGLDTTIPATRRLRSDGLPPQRTEALT